MERKPDFWEKLIRFGCGFVFGGFAAFYIAIQIIDGGTRPFWAFVAIAAVVSGLLAIRYGDEFWWWIPWL